jgi:hypothetical protein
VRHQREVCILWLRSFTGDGVVVEGYLSIDKPNIVQMGKLNNSIDVRQKPTLNGTLNGTSLKYLNMV